MGHRELDLGAARRLKLERHPRRLLAAKDLVEFHLPAVGQAAIRHAVQNLTGIVYFAAAAENHTTAAAPIGFDWGAEPERAGDRPIGEALPQLFRRGRDVGDIDEFRL